MADNIITGLIGFLGSAGLLKAIVEFLKWRAGQYRAEAEQTLASARKVDCEGRAVLLKAQAEADRTRAEGAATLISAGVDPTVATLLLQGPDPPDQMRAPPDGQPPPGVA